MYILLIDYKRSKKGDIIARTTSGSCDYRYYWYENLNTLEAFAADEVEDNPEIFQKQINKGDQHTTANSH